MPQEHSVGIILFNKDKYLLLHYTSGHWSYVKGKVEANEEPEDTARRELFEETGITTVFFVRDFKEKEEYFYKKEGRTVHKEVIYFLAETQEENITLSKEHTDYKWLSYQEAMNLLTFPQAKELLKKAEEFKRYH
ncbi:MAG: NUDIX domain-containing protein [bacterium]|nr:NUDIX domain-containing protein [bacterium]